MKFHDGNPVTAEDVKFTCEYMLKWKSAYFSEALSKIDKIDAVSSTGLVFHLNEPYAPLLTRICSGNCQF